MFMTNQITHHHSLSDDLDPNEYTLIGTMYVGISEDMNEAYQPDHERLRRYFATDDWRDRVRWSRMTKSGNMTGNCVLCGSGFSHGVVYRHTSGEHVAVGHICARNYLQWDDVDEKNRAKRQRIAKATRENAERREQCAKDWNRYLAEYPEIAVAVNESGDHWLIKDIVRSVLEYRGVPSDKQHDLILKIHRDERAKAAAADEPEVNWIPIPYELFDGRHSVTGTILSTKVKESRFGCTLKMLVQVDTDEGSFKLWGSVPSTLESQWDDDKARYTACAGKGDVVTFTARIEVASWSDDTAFGVFERPTKGSFVSRADDNE